MMLRDLGAMVRPGISTQDLDDAACKIAKEHGYINAPLNYHGFPRSICTSVNQVVCHGIPTSACVLKEGDTVGVDVTPIVGGFHGDTCATFYVGEVSAETRKLVETTAHALQKGIEVVRPGATIGDIGHAISTYARAQGFSVVREFVGHAIGRVFHGDMMVPHVGKPGDGPRLEVGMTFTIEPMLNAGREDTRVLDDGWTAITKDGSLSAQFEHTVVVTPTGVEILTCLPDEDPMAHSPGRVVVF